MAFSGNACSPGKRPLALRTLAPYNFTANRGGVAQLGERIVRIDEVVGSIPILSTTQCNGTLGCRFLFPYGMEHWL